MLASQEIMDRLKGGLAAFVVPAFEFHKQSDGVDPATFPADKTVSGRGVRRAKNKSIDLASSRAGVG